MQASVDVILLPADRLRRAVLRLGVGWAGPRLVRREGRVALLGTVQIGLLFVLSLAAPLWLLALGPIVLGVPHLAADLRFLVARPGLHRRRWLWAAVGLPVLSQCFGAPLWAGLLGVAGACLLARGASWRRAAGVAAALGAAAWAAGQGYLATLVLAHAHNFIAVVFWWRWRRRSGRGHWIPLGAFAAGCAGVLLLADAVASSGWGLPFPGMNEVLWAQLAALAPDPSSGPAARWILLFAFAQAVHYAVWLRLIPEEDRPREAPLSLRSAWRGWKEDLGAWTMGLCALASAAIAGWACLDLSGARWGYLSFAGFHAVLELAAAGIFWIEAGRSGGEAFR